MSAMEKEVFLPHFHPPRRQRSNFWYLGVIRATSVYAIIVSEASHSYKETSKKPHTHLNKQVLPRADLGAAMKSTLKDVRISSMCCPKAHVCPSSLGRR